jgi:hypothetical protein
VFPGSVYYLIESYSGHKIKNWRRGNLNLSTRFNYKCPVVRRLSLETLTLGRSMGTLGQIKLNKNHEF